MRRMGFLTIALLAVSMVAGPLWAYAADEGFETGDFSAWDWHWLLWSVTSAEKHSGAYSAHAGHALPVTGIDSFLYVVLQTNSGYLSFYAKVNTNNRLYFQLAPRRYDPSKDKWYCHYSGDNWILIGPTNGWQKKSFSVPAGYWCFTWSNFSQYFNDIWIDDIDFPPLAGGAEVEFAKLDTEKWQYAPGETVKVIYHVTNSGTATADYYVRYVIKDPSGTEVYSQRGGDHTIAPGETDRWYSKKWTVPPNAPAGQYIVEASCISTGGTDEATTSFTVVGSPAPSGNDTIGVYGSTFYLKNSHAGGAANHRFNFGPPGSSWLAIAGDWDGDGIDTIGLFDPYTRVFILKNSHGGGAADIRFRFGPEGVLLWPIAGDWDGDGIDTIGLYEYATGTFRLKNSHGGGAADLKFRFGDPGFDWLAVAGDWDGDSKDTVGLSLPADGTFILKNSHAGGAADIKFHFGPGGMWPIAGDWDGDGIDTIGLYKSATGVFRLKNSHAGGAADIKFAFGPHNKRPLAGDWDGGMGGSSLSLVSPTAPRALAVSDVFSYPNPLRSGRVHFAVEGQGISALKVEIFDLSGRNVFDSEFVTGNELAWNLTSSSDNQALANGVYLYIITVKGYKGEILRSEVKKMAILR